MFNLIHPNLFGTFEKRVAFPLSSWKLSSGPGMTAVHFFFISRGAVSNCPSLLLPSLWVEARWRESQAGWGGLSSLTQLLWTPVMLCIDKALPPHQLTGHLVVAIFTLLATWGRGAGGRGRSPVSGQRVLERPNVRGLRLNSRLLPVGPALGGLKSSLGAATCFNKSLSSLPQFLHFYLSKKRGN